MKNKKNSKNSNGIHKSLPIEALCHGSRSLHIHVQEFPSLIQHRQVPSAIPEPLLK